MEISASTLLAIVTVVAIAAVGWSVWLAARGSGGAVTPEAIVAAMGKIPGVAKQMYDDAVIAVQYVEQISKPSDPDDLPLLTNEQKKARAMAVIKRRWPDANVEDISAAIEAAVYGVKALGVKLPTVTIVGADVGPKPPTGDLDILDTWSREQSGGTGK